MVLAEVIVDAGGWALDKELTYEVPSSLAGLVRIGSVVRVRLRNRRVRGWVVGISRFDPPPPAAEMPANLQPIAAVSGRGPVFDEALLKMARSLSRYYVQPLSSFLSLFTPARLGRPLREWPAMGKVFTPLGGDPEGVSMLVRLPPQEDPLGRYVAAIKIQLGLGAGVIVAVPEVREGSRILEKLAAEFPDDAAIVHSGRDEKDRSDDLWAVAEGRKRLVLGGRGALFAPAFPLGLIIVHQEHDPSFKDQRAPYCDARQAGRARVAATGGVLKLNSTTPSLTSMALYAASGAFEEPERAGERAGWPIVETVDPPKTGIARRLTASIIEARTKGHKALILMPRVKATRAGPGPGEVEHFLSRVVPGAIIARADRPALGDEPGALAAALDADVVIATEAALTEIERPQVPLGIAVGVDSYFLNPTGRAAEDAFAALWALGGLVSGQRPRGRLLLETGNPGDHVIQALVRGDYGFFAKFELKERSMNDAPPFRTLIKLKLRQWPSDELIQALSTLPGTDILGPAPGGRLGVEILLKVTSIEPILDGLGTIVRQSPERILVEMEPKQW
ncbi:MAG: hypothetical protein ACR2FO_06755 [Actinomycetota bacterium]